MTEFEQQVAEALATVPHSDDCASKPDSHIEGTFRAAGQLLTVLEIRRLLCTCDRAERQAVRVAAAIELAYKKANGVTSFGPWLDSYSAALAALRGPT